MNNSTKAILGKDKILLGKRKEDNAPIFISKPSFDCNWYWSFGYLGNNNEHYHLDSYQNKEHFLKLEGGGFKVLTEKRNKCMRDCLLEDYELSPIIEKNLWQFCELAKTIYSIKVVAEICKRGGSNYTTNNCKDILKNEQEYNRLTFEVLPELLQAFWDLIQD